MSKQGLASKLAWIGVSALLFAVAPGSAWAGCSVSVADPTAHRIAGERTIVGAGTRGSDCKENKIFIVRLRHHRTLWFDETVDEVHFTVRNGTLRVKYRCRGAGVKTFFTEAWVQGEDKHKSNYKKFQACG